MAVKQTAGRTALGEFAPKFAELNDDVLFGQVWSREDKLSLKERSLITVVALLSQGLTDTSFVHHLESAKANGITKSEIAEIITHAAFYAGWPKAWAAFRLAKDIWKEDANEVLPVQSEERDRCACAASGADDRVSLRVPDARRVRELRHEGVHSSLFCFLRRQLHRKRHPADPVGVAD